MWNFKKTIITVLFFLQLLNFAFASNKMIRFPSEISESISTNGEYILYNVNYESEILNHALFLKDLNTKETEKLYSYSRYVKILWSPKGNKLIVNDAGGSDFTNCIIFLFNSKKESIDIKYQLEQKVKDNRSIFDNHHVYIEGVEWVDENKVKIKISGYGDVDPDGFTLWYEYTIGDEFKYIKRVNKVEEKY